MCLYMYMYMYIQAYLSPKPSEPMTDLESLDTIF